MLVGPGENAGAVDVGDGLAVAFKVESHNHPSAVEPFQGAATGVGGILRDVFAVGARPIAVLDSLRFGEPADSQRSRYLLEHAVAGIGHYGNSIGVPDDRRRDLLRAELRAELPDQRDGVGLAPHERLIRAPPRGPGNVLVLFGALTGRDGIGGASVLASAELGDGDDAKRPTVQIGDPFAEKKLMECSLELLDRGLLAALQDLGAAGLTSSASEMAQGRASGSTSTSPACRCARPDMAPFEIMVSESQERMLCVVEPERVGEVIGVCEKWETLAMLIGNRIIGITYRTRRPNYRRRLCRADRNQSGRARAVRPARRCAHDRSGLRMEASRARIRTDLGHRRFARVVVGRRDACRLRRLVAAGHLWGADRVRVRRSSSSSGAVCGAWHSIYPLLLRKATDKRAPTVQSCSKGKHRTTPTTVQCSSGGPSPDLPSFRSRVSVSLPAVQRARPEGGSGGGSREGSGARERRGRPDQTRAGLKSPTRPPMLSKKLIGGLPEVWECGRGLSDPCPYPLPS